MRQNQCPDGGESLAQDAQQRKAVGFGLQGNIYYGDVSFRVGVEVGHAGAGGGDGDLEVGEGVGPVALALVEERDVERGAGLDEGGLRDLVRAVSESVAKAEARLADLTKRVSDLENQWIPKDNGLF